MRENAPFREDFVCRVRSLEYDFERREGKLFLPKHSCASMYGAIRLFQKIDSNVRMVQIFSGGIEDALHVLDDGEKWRALMPRKTP